VGVRLDPIVSNRELFLWDEIAVVGLERKISRIARRNPGRAADLEYLIARGFLVDLPGTLSTVRTVLSGLVSATTETRFTVRTSSARAERTLRVPDPELAEGYERLLATALSRPGTTAVPLVGAPDPECRRPRSAAAVRVIDDAQQTIQPILDVIASRVPVPGDGVPLEALADLREDPELKRLRLQLRRWIMTTAATEVDLVNLASELDALRADCANYLRVKRMDASDGVIRAFVPGENTLPNPKQLVDVGLSLKGRRARAYVSELEAPGRPFAFLDEIGTRMWGTVTAR
jgi:hypothetical protein